MDLQQTRDLVMSALAEKTGKDLPALTAELAAAGAEYPYDSVWLVSAGARAAKQMGVKLRHVRRHAKAFKSVDALAAYLHQVEQEQAAA
jgi:hypothetical protein